MICPLKRYSDSNVSQTSLAWKSAIAITIDPCRCKEHHHAWSRSTSNAAKSKLKKAWLTTGVVVFDQMLQVLLLTFKCSSSKFKMFKVLTLSSLLLTIKQEENCSVFWLLLESTQLFAKHNATGPRTSFWHIRNEEIHILKNTEVSREITWSKSNTSSAGDACKIICGGRHPGSRVIARPVEVFLNSSFAPEMITGAQIYYTYIRR